MLLKKSSILFLFLSSIQLGFCDKLAIIMFDGFRWDYVDRILAKVKYNDNT